ncbi:MAG: hypothetical protein ACLFSQ_11915 [Candidatus Zixiibacteriota bacterium]
MIVLITIMLFLLVSGCQETNVFEINDFDNNNDETNHVMLLHNGDSIVFDYNVRLSDLENRVELDNAYRRVL